MNPKDLWYEKFSYDKSEALDALRIVASFVTHEFGTYTGTSVFDAACAVSDYVMLHAKLLTLLYEMRRHMGPISNQDAAQQLVSAIESGQWPKFGKPNKWLPPSRVVANETGGA